MTEHVEHLPLLLLTNIPAPYRVPVWNHLEELTEGRTKVLFLTSGESRRKWAVPIEQMKFNWQILSSGSDPNLTSSQVASAAATLAYLFRSWPRAVVCGGYDSLAAWASFAWCKVFRRRFVLWLESNARDERHPGWAKQILKRWIVAGADAIAAAGAATTEYAVDLGANPERVFLAPFGGDNETFSRAAGQVDVAAEKCRNGYPGKLILYSGRLVRVKGVFVLLEAYRKVSARLADVGLLVVGHGPDEAAMRQQCEEMGLRNVFFVGPQPYERVPYYYALADVLALPTFSDPWGYVINEAFACGVPAVVSNVAGACDDLIVNGQTGFAVEPGDPRELAEKILRVLKDRMLRARMGANCRELIDQYSAEACAEGLLAAALGSRK